MGPGQTGHHGGNRKESAKRRSSNASNGSNTNASGSHSGRPGPQRSASGTKTTQQLQEEDMENGVYEDDEDDLDSPLKGGIGSDRASNATTSTCSFKYKWS